MLKYFTVLFISFSLSAAEFQGWEGLRVLPVEGGVSASDSGDVEGNGRETLFIANRRQSRIDIYKWLEPTKRKKADKSNSPNELPFAEDFERKEIILERPPFDILLKNFDDDKEKELIVLTTLPLTLHLYDLVKGKWEVTESWKLPNQTPQSLSILSYENSVLVSTPAGVIVQDLKKNAPAKWMKPKETNIRRMNWWAYDVDQDGNKDLVDLIIDTSNRARFRWFARHNKQFLPAVPLGDIEGTYGQVDESAQDPTFFFHNPIRNNTVNEYTLIKGEESLFGSNRILPVLNIRENLRTTVQIEGKNCLVEIDPERPMMRVSELGDTGFTELGKFPVLRQTTTIVSPEGQSSILMQVGDSPDLYISKWENNRFTYPKVYVKNSEKEDSKLLGLGKHGGISWWIQADGNDLTLFTWAKGQAKSLAIPFKGIAKGLDKAFWLGGKAIMVKKKYAKYASFYLLKGDKPELFQAPHLKDAVENQFKFFNKGGKLEVARIVDGIIQLYGEDLQPVDQIMLEDGSKIVDAVYKGETMYVLDSSGEKVHSLSKDKSGLMKEDTFYEVLAANSISNDPYLGILLGNTKFINAVTNGKPLEFKLKNSINEKLGLPAGVKNAKINHFHILDVAGTARKELINVDFNRRQLTLIDISKREPVSLASWKVYDDGKYPYSDGTDGGNSSSNPYMIISLDFDGDGIKELVMGCHDRLLIYLGREK